MVSTRSSGGGAAGPKPKQPKLEDLDVASVEKKTSSRTNGSGRNKATKETSRSKVKPTSTSTSTTNKSTTATSNSGRKRKARQPPTPPPVESTPSDRPEQEGRPRKVPRGSVPSDPVGAAQRAAETRRKDQRGGDRKGGAAGGGGATAAAAKADATKKAQKATKQEDDDGDGDGDGDDGNKPIMINRAPVLTLWAACVTAFLHPEIKWEGCLSAGAAVAALCAVSKGRAIGKIEPKDDQDGDKAGKKKESKRKAESETQTIRVMHFPLRLKPDKTTVLVSGKPKTQSEDNLISKFGGQDAYDAVKAAMEGGLRSWTGKGEDELDGKAFGMYEKFRPSVPQGGRGWGRKGELRVGRIAEVVGRG